MILLIVPAPQVSELQHRLQDETGETVQTARNVTSALRLLRRDEFEAVVLDQSFAYDPAISVLFQHAGTAVPVSVNAAVSNCSRIASQVKSALLRRRADCAAARRAASRELREDLRNAITGIMLSSELALDAPSVPASVQMRLREVLHLAEGIKRSLEL